MCNIAGYAGDRQAAPILVEMLKKQRYFDGGMCTGIATVHEGKIYSRRVFGDIDVLLKETDALSLPGTLGFIHSRPGGEREAFEYIQPFVMEDGSMAVIENGVCQIDDLTPQRNGAVDMLVDNGYTFRSVRLREKDGYPQLKTGHYVATGESVMRLTDYYHRQGKSYAEALAMGVSDIYTDIVSLMLNVSMPDTISVVRLSRPMHILLGEGETFLATTEFAFPEDVKGESMSLPLMHTCLVTKDGFSVTPYKVKGEDVCAITPMSYAKAYDRIVKILKGKKDAPVDYDVIEVAVWKEMTDVWSEQHRCMQYARLAYEVLYQLYREGRLKMIVRQADSRHGMRPRAFMWIEE